MPLLTFTLLVEDSSTVEMCQPEDEDDDASEADDDDDIWINETGSRSYPGPPPLLTKKVLKQWLKHGFGT